MTEALQAMTEAHAEALLEVARLQEQARELASTWDLMADGLDRKADRTASLVLAAQNRARGAQLRTCANVLRALLLAGDVE